MGKEWQTLFDDGHRPVEIRHATLYPVRLEYDADGRIGCTRQGTGSLERAVFLGYGSDGYLQGIIGFGAGMSVLVPYPSGTAIKNKIIKRLSP
jgi:YD repeat-containing protein